LPNRLAAEHNLLCFAPSPGLKTCGTLQSLYLVLLAQPLGQDREEGGLLTRAPKR